MPRPGRPIARVQGGYKNAFGLLRSVTQPDVGAALRLVILLDLRMRILSCIVAAGTARLSGLDLFTVQDRR